MSKKKSKQTPLTLDSISFIVDFEGMGFSEEQIKNISSIVTKVFAKLTGEYGSCGSGGHFYHMFFKLKTGEWLGFHSGTGDVTVSDKYKTFEKLYEAFWENSNTVTGKYINHFTTDGAIGQDDFSAVDIITKDILERNFKKVLKTGGEAGGKFNINKSISTKKDVENFFMHLLAKESVNFHPDDDFVNYVGEGNKPTYTKEEAELRNKRMDEAFAVCEKDNCDIYGIAIEQLHKFDPKLKEVMEGDLISLHDIIFTPARLNKESKGYWQNYFNVNAPNGANTLTREFLRLVAENKEKEAFEFFDKITDARDIYVINTVVEKATGEPLNFWRHKKAEGGTLRIKSSLVSGTMAGSTYRIEHIGFKNLSKKVAAFYKHKGVPASEAKIIGNKVAGKVKAQMAEHYAAGGAMNPNVTIRTDWDMTVQQPYRAQLEQLFFGAPDYHTQQVITPSGDQWFDVRDQWNRVIAFSADPAKIVELLETKMSSGGSIEKRPFVWVGLDTSDHGIWVAYSESEKRTASSTVGFHITQEEFEKRSVTPQNFREYFNNTKLGKGGGLHRSQGGFMETIRKAQEDELKAAGFDVDKLTQEQRDLITMPSDGPENFYQDGEVTFPVALASWKLQMRHDGLSDEIIRKAVSYQFGNRKATGGAAGGDRYVVDGTDGNWQIKDTTTNKATTVEGLPKPPYKTQSEAESIAFAINHQLEKGGKVKPMGNLLQELKKIKVYYFDKKDFISAQQISSAMDVVEDYLFIENSE